MRKIKVFGSGVGKPRATQEDIDKWLEESPYKPEIIQVAATVRDGGMPGLDAVLFVLYELRKSE